MAISVTRGAGYIRNGTMDHLLSRGEKVVALDNLARGRRKGADATDWWISRLVHEKYFLQVVAADGDRRVHFVDLNEKLK